MRWLDVDGARLHLSDGQTKRNEKTQTDEPIVSRKTVYAIVKAGMRVAPRGDSGAEARVVDARGVAIEMLAASEADLRAALVDLAERAFWQRQTYLRVLDLADDARMAAVREHDQLAEENARLRDQLTWLLRQAMREAA